MFVIRFITLTVLVSLFACTSNEEQKELSISKSKESSLGLPVESSKHDRTAKNVILMIGDGMGLAQITAAMEAREQPLELELFKVIGLAKTGSAIESITDSAASATAIATGVKTRNGVVGIDKDGIKQETILEFLGNKGYATGIIATSTITHATPASFYAHEFSRNNYYQIAAQMKGAPLDLFIGGGRSHFVDRTDKKNGKTDQRNIREEMAQDGFVFVDSLKDIQGTTDRVGYFIADIHPEPVLKGRGNVLPASIPVAISHLQSRSDQGFFLVVEGAQIDWGGHANDDDYMISELYDFDAAVGNALDFSIADGNTLLIVTADHETGGLSLSAEPERENELTSYKSHVHDFTTNGHTAVMVPVFAFGPGSERFSGTYENTAIHDKMLRALKNK